MKRSQLQELVRHITRSILKEFIPPGTDKSSTSMTDPNTPPEDAMSPGLKARMEREKEKNRRNDIKNKEAELKTAKTKMDAQKKETDQIRRFTTPALQKDIQRLKGANL